MKWLAGLVCVFRGHQEVVTTKREVVHFVYRDVDYTHCKRCGEQLKVDKPGR